MRGADASIGHADELMPLVDAAEERARAVVFAGDGEMRERCHQFDWASTTLGPVATWPVSLRATVMNMLASRHPMFLFWGPDLVQIYNDAYRPSLGGDGRHVQALGARGVDFWTEIWWAIGPQIEQVISGGPSTWHENQLISIDRNHRREEVYWTYSYGPAYDDDGTIGGVLVVCQETTAQVLLLKQLEIERSPLEYAFQQAPSFVAVLRGPPYVFESVNAAYLQLVGHRDIVGKLVFDALPDTRGQGFEALLDSVVRTGEPFVGREMPLNISHTPGAAPEERLLNFVYFPLVEADGSRSGVIAHGVDVTDQVQARRDVERLLAASELARTEADAARGEADAANRAKADFLAMLSHELRTPLAAIGGYAELLEMGVHGTLPEEQRKFVARIQHSQNHLLGLIDGLLVYAQVDAGAVRYALESVDLNEVLATCEALTAPQFQTRQVTFKHIGCDDVHLVALADREKLKQVVLNLLSNAVKFTEAGGKVTVECHQHDASSVSVTVTDTGRGIGALDVDRVFEPFVQIDAKASRNNTGTGLGLAISRTLARGMGGELSVESVLGAGSVFRIVLPAA
jgi:signal transduction histidine kinase